MRVDLLCLKVLLLGSASPGRADVGASAAVTAGIGIDDILGIALADGTSRTLGLAGTTHNTLIANDISHCIHLLPEPIGLF